MGSNTKAQTEAQVVKTLNAVRRLVRVVRSIATEVERDTGLSTAQAFVLQLLAAASAGSMNELADRTATDQSSVSVVVSRLEEKGLAARRQSSTDARRTEVHITAKGRDLLAHQPQTVQGRLVRALRAMPQQSLVSLEHELQRLIATMGATDEPASLIFEDDATGTP